MFPARALFFHAEMKRQTTLFLALSLVLLSGTLSAQSSRDATPARPSEWATAVSGTSVLNLYQIEDGFYRGAQPTAAGFQELADLGVRSVLNLAGGVGDRLLAGDGSVKLFHVPMSASGLRDDLVLQALRIMVDPENRPLMIHCRHGADRTGALVALYRVVVQGWTKDQAVREMNKGGYHHNALWRNLDWYVLKADAAALRRELGLPASLEPKASLPVLAVIPIPAAATGSPE